jgi:hypothetical protein
MSREIAETRRTILFTWLAWATMITVNALANILPIGGYQTGEISAFYPNRFVPAGFTFSIWGIIYLLLLAYNITLTVFLLKSTLAEHPARVYIKRVTSLYWWSCVLNVMWILCWHYLQAALSLVVMLFMLFTLIRIFINGRKGIRIFPLWLQTFLIAPFTVYLGWISVATIANVTAYLVKINWKGGPLEPEIWSAVMITTAIVLALFMLIRFRTAGYALTIAWALWGIHAAQGPKSDLLLRISFAGVIALVAVAVIERIVTYFFTSNNFKTIGW